MNTTEPKKRTITLTDRRPVTNAITVALKDDYRIDDVQPLVAAILQLKGVSRATPHIVDNPELWAREQKVKTELRERLIALIKEL
jgi:uncharacterized OB-fold protein